jgi:hypothetical protein
MPVAHALERSPNRRDRRFLVALIPGEQAGDVLERDRPRGTAPETPAAIAPIEAAACALLPAIAASGSPTPPTFRPT